MVLVLSEMLDTELILNTDKIYFDELGKFKIGLKVSNKGDEEINFDISKTMLFINGERSISWDLTVQNGTIINLSVPAKSHKSVWWSLGKALFSVSGKYKISLHTENNVRECKITVL